MRSAPLSRQLPAAADSGDLYLSSEAEALVRSAFHTAPICFPSTSAFVSPLTDVKTLAVLIFLAAALLPRLNRRPGGKDRASVSRARVANEANPDGEAAPGQLWCWRCFDPRSVPHRSEPAGFGGAGVAAGVFPRTGP